MSTRTGGRRTGSRLWPVRRSSAVTSSGVAMAVVLATLLTVGTATPVAASAASSPAWVTQTQFAVSGENIIPEATAATGDTIWVAGWAYNGIEFRTLALRRTNGVWAQVPTPDIETAPAEDFLYGVDAVSASNVWMVGSSAVSSSDLAGKPLVEHWDGKVVRVVPVPDPGSGTGAGLAAVSGSREDLWAVGETTQSGTGTGEGLVMHSEGGSWSAVPFRLLVPGCNSTLGANLLAVTQVSVGDIYVGGECTPSSGDSDSRAFVEHYDHGLWSASFSVQGYGQIDSLTSAGDGTVWAAGWQQSTGGGAGWSRGLALHGSCTTFTAVDQPIPKAGSYAQFLGITASGATATAVGTGTSAEPPFAGFGAYGLAGAVWNAEPVQNNFGGFGAFHAVTRDASGGLLAAGFGISSSGSDVGVVSERAG